MSKIICDICGTSYQDTAECCPICGCSRGMDEDLTADAFLLEESMENSGETAGKAASKKKQIFDYDEVNTSLSQDDSDIEEEELDYDEEEEYEEEPRHNTLVVILLTVLIAALLLAAGFIFVRYFLPNMGADEETVPETTLAHVEDTTATTELRIPCETLILNSALKAELTGEGFSHLINVMPSPKDTTDQLMFTSEDPSIATVSEDGKITAVAEGETIVTISCGDVQMMVSVICDFTPETEPPTEETAEATEEAPAEETSGDAVEETEAEAENDGTKEVDSSIVLKLKKSDISLGAYYQFRLELDCDLDPKDVEWSSEHPYVASVNEEGVVTALMKGAVTDIIVKYGDQEVRCKVRVV